MEENEKKQIIERLMTALEFYADPRYWGRMYDHYKNDQRVWLGPGNGQELAERALRDTEEARRVWTKSRIKTGDSG